MGIWGKLIGSVAGLALGGPLGALVGAAAGHAVDKLREENLAGLQPAGGATWSPHGGREVREMAFSVAVIVLGAKMAKVDGVVTRAEIDAFKQVFRIPPGELRSVARIFNAAKRDAGGFEPYARQVGLLFRNEPAILEELLAGLFHVARADGSINQVELNYLRHVSDIMGLDGLQFARVRDRFIQPEAADPFQVLGVSGSASDDEVKRAYRRLIRENHPDTLVARGLPREFAAQANEKMAQINAAYDEISRRRGLN